MKKRSVKIRGHATSISLEEPFWLALKDLAKAQNLSVNQLIARIDEKDPAQNLSSALRVFVLQSLQHSSSVTPVVSDAKRREH